MATSRGGDRVVTSQCTSSKHKRTVNKMHKKKLNAAAAMWCIWLERNSQIFSSKIMPHACILHRINSLIDVWTGQEYQIQLLATSSRQQRRDLMAKIGALSTHSRRREMENLVKGRMHHRGTQQERWTTTQGSNLPEEGITISFVIGDCYLILKVCIIICSKT